MTLHQTLAAAKRGALLTCLALAICACALASTAPSALAAPQAPVISKESVAGVGETSATLKATINPGERPTKYRFEYVDQASFEAEGFAAAARVPIPDGSIPAGSEGVAVQVTLEGLIPGTAYRFRVFAKNSIGEPTGPERLFATFAPPPSFGPCPNDPFRTGELSPSSHPSAALPDCRAYEQASPVDKNGSDALGTVNTVGAADDGGAFAFATQFGIPGGEGAQNIPTFLASRDEGGWSTHGLLPPAAAGTDAQVLGWQSDFSRVFSSASLSGETRETGFFSRPGSGGPATQLAPYTSFQNGVGEYSFVGASAEGSQVFFEAATDLGTSPPGLEGRSNVYAWDREDQTLRLAAVMNDGQPPAKGAFAGPYDWALGDSNANLGNGGAARGYYTQEEHAVSADGSALYFTAAGTGQIYLRRNPSQPQSAMSGDQCTEPEKACTFHVSATKRSAPDPAGTRPAVLMAAAADGSTALFTSSEELTGDANTGPVQPAATIARADIGGSPLEADFIPTHAVGVAVDSEYVYWADPTAGTIGRAELDGNNPDPEFIVPGPVEFEVEVETSEGEFETEAVIAPSRPRYVAVDAGHIYWTNTGRLDENGDPAKAGGTIGRADIEGTLGSVEADFIRGAFDPQGIAVNASHIYWANSSRQAQTISRAGIEGDEVEASFFKAKGSGDLPYGVALSAGHVYFSLNHPGASSVFIGQLPSEGGAVKYVGMEGEAKLRGIAVDGSHVYWATQGEEVIGRIPIADFGGFCGAILTCEKDFIPAEGALEGLAADSEHLYFSSNGEAPPNPGKDLYRYDAGSGALSDLTPDSAEENGAEVQGVLGTSKDGSFVYFVANGDLDGPAGPATPGNCHGKALSDTQGSCNLYLWHEGTSDFITRLRGGAAQLGDTYGWLAWAPTPSELRGGGSWKPKTAFAAADGHTLLFLSADQLTAYENEGTAELYRYRLGEPLACISCNPSGAAPLSDPTLGSVALPVLQPRPPAAVAARNLSADGERAFFETTEALVAADTDGQAGCPLIGGQASCQDVYEWEAPGSGSCEEGGPGFSAPNGGCLYLLSPGNDGVPSIFGDASSGGEDVFIFTRTPLVGQDEDELFDVYDARVGGGLPSQNEPPKVPCEGEACKHAQAPPPSFEGPAGFSGPANPTAKRPGACPKGKRRAKSRCVVKKKNKGHGHRKHGRAQRARRGSA